MRGTRGTQLKHANKQLLEKLRLGAYAEARRFQTIQSLAFQEIWQKKYSKNHVNNLSQNWSEVWQREFLLPKSKYQRIPLITPGSVSLVRHLASLEQSSNDVSWGRRSEQILVPWPLGF